MTTEELEKFPTVYSVWMANVMFSCHPKMVKFANMVNRGDMDKWSNFLFYQGLAKRHLKNVTFIQYLSKKPKQTKEIEYVMRRFNCKMDIAKEYIQLLEKEELEQIYDKYNKIDNPDKKTKIRQKKS